MDFSAVVNFSILIYILFGMKVLFVFLFWVSVNFSLYAQVYTPIPLNTAAWVGNEYYIFGNTVYGDWLTTSIGDTIMQGKRYVHFRPHTFWYGMPNEYIEPEFYLRNDTATHRVYMMRQYEFHERVLFDFNLQVGDTLEGYYRFSSGDSIAVFTVTNRMMVNFGYGPRVVIDFQYAPNRLMRWIEGVGSLGGMVFPEIAMFEGGSSLGCFYEQIQVSTPVVFNSFSTCNLNVGLPQEHEVQLRLKTVASRTVEIEHYFSSPLKMEVYTINGTLIYSGILPSGAHPFSLEKWSTNCFVFRFFSQDGKVNLVRKVVV
jgi:hypothetical protein